MIDIKEILAFIDRQIQLLDKKKWSLDDFEDTTHDVGFIVGNIKVAMAKAEIKGSIRSLECLKKMLENELTKINNNLGSGI